MKLIIHTDGGARGNPGPAAIGIVIEDNLGVKHSYQQVIGHTTNNIAEYTAVLQSINLIMEKYGTCEAEVEYLLDSELVVKQLRGEYKVKNEELKKIHSLIRTEHAKFAKVKYTHIPREQNKEADALVNAALDSQI
jgi:ribonuclease HI